MNKNPYKPPDTEPVNPRHSYKEPIVDWSGLFLVVASLFFAIVLMSIAHALFPPLFSFVCHIVPVTTILLVERLL